MIFVSVTKKEFVFATSSEDEENGDEQVVDKNLFKNGSKGKQESKPVKTEPKISSQELKQKSSPQKTKQASIRNFFGKKS